MFAASQYIRMGAVMADDAFLAAVSGAAELPNVHFRVFVVAWGQAFLGEVSTAREYDRAMLSRVKLPLPESMDPKGEPALARKKSETAMTEALTAKANDTASYLYLKSVRTQLSDTIPWLRIPLEDVTAHSLTTH